LADAGRALIERGRNRDGISVLELNLEANPRDADALAAVARGHLALGDTAAAVGLYRRALAADDAHAAALEMLRRLGAGGAQGGTP
jgi:hypothetical protein